MAKTTTEFLSGVKRRITMPENQVLLSDADMLDMASDTLRTKMTKLLKGAQQNYLLTTEDIAIVASQSNYDIPYRSVVGGLEEVKFLYSDGLTLKNLSLVDVEDLELFSQGSSNPTGFYFQGDEIIVVPTPSSGEGSLRYWYHRQLSRLCETGDAGQVTAIASNVITVDNVPATYIAGYEVDFIKSLSLSAVLGQDVAITNVAGNQLTFALADIPNRLRVGDWISPAFETPVLPLPDECYDYFEAACAVTILKAIGDNEGAASIMAEASDLEKDVKSLLEPRIDGEPDKIVNYHGLLRSKSWRRLRF